MKAHGDYGWDRPAVRAALDAAAGCAAEVAALARRIAEVPAPTFHEAERAAFVRDRLADLGLAPEVDAAGNAVARRAGRERAGALLLAAHTDTVFPLGTDLTVYERDGRLYGPGIGDNSLAVAALLTLPRLLDDAGLRTRADLILCANTGEEGLGDLRGIKQAIADRRDGLGAVVALEGHNLGRVTHQAVGSRRFRVTVEGPGGHSWGAFGNPSAIHVLGAIIAAIARLDVPREPKTTFNVGLIEGGVSVNTIAPRASLVLDLRSLDRGALEALVGRVDAIVRGAATPEIRVHSEVIGDRPAGTLPVEAPIVQTTLAALRRLGVEPVLDASSTDANVPIALGIPAVCIGLTLGGHAHRTDEYIETAPIGRGMQQLVLLVAALAGAEG
ncbi:MAG TPA: M20/M25/M40 family metallo-hydrolase [Thermomicrobiales bacterium]|nr:M20/M25/M40 family metallo-hydrolase [Thermomicrobiales bacterium]